MVRSDASGGNFSAKKKWLERLGLFALGAFTGLGHAPFDVWPATILGLAGIVYLMGRFDGAGGKPARYFAVRAWWIGFGFFALTLHWIVEPFLVDVARHGWMAPFALVLLSGGLALFWGAAGWIAGRLNTRSDPRMIAFGTALVVAELARSTILTGFPWALPAYGLTASGILSIAAIWGPHGVGALLILLATGLALLAQRYAMAGLVCVGVSVVTVAMSFAFLPEIQPSQDTSVIRIVQPNAPQNEKWQQGKAREFLDRQLAFTRDGAPVDLVIWPETSVAFTINDVAPLAADAARGGAVMFGAQRFDAGRYYNALAVTGPQGITDVYEKHHLVPFGEYIPLGNQLGKIGIRGLAENDGGGFASGAAPKPMLVAGIGPVLALICYESIFPHLSWMNDTRANLIVVATNDAWFGQFAGPQQHLAQSQWRAAEQGVPLVRSANTGISAMIDARGQIVASLGMGEAGYFDAPLPAKTDAGLYARHGGILQMILLGLCLFGLFIIARAKQELTL